MRDAVTEGPANVQAEIAKRYVAEFGLHNGYLIGEHRHTTGPTTRCGR